MSSRLECERTSEGERKREEEGRGTKAGRVNKGNEGKFIYSLGSALRSPVKQKGLFLRDLSLSLSLSSLSRRGERREKMARNLGGNEWTNEGRRGSARFNRNGKRLKSWQIFTFEIYKNPVFRSSLSRIFYNGIRIVISHRLFNRLAHFPFRVV